MSDYINRQAALDALGERPLVWTEDDYYSLGARNQYNGDRLAIETIPHADVEPVRHGRWQVNEMFGYKDMTCTSCGWLFEYYGGLEEEWNYCPHCGARMDGGDEND